MHRVVVTAVFVLVLCGVKAADIEAEAYHRSLVLERSDLSYRIYRTFHDRIEFRWTNSVSSLRIVDALFEETADRNYNERIAQFGDKAIKSGIQLALRTYLVEESGIKERLSEWARNTLVSLATMTLSGRIEQDNQVSPFNHEEGYFSQDTTRTLENLRYGFRISSIDRPYAFVGHTFKNTFKEVVATVQSRYYLRDWDGRHGTAEVGVHIPLLHSLTLGTGIYFYPREYLFDEGRDDESSFQGFIGVEGMFKKWGMAHFGFTYGNNSRAILAWSLRF